MTMNEKRRYKQNMSYLVGFIKKDTYLFLTEIKIYDMNIKMDNYIRMIRRRYDIEGYMYVEEIYIKTILILSMSRLDIEGGIVYSNLNLNRLEELVERFSIGLVSRRSNTKRDRGVVIKEESNTYNEMVSFVPIVG